MAEETFKPVTEESVGLTPAEIKYLVTGAQKYLPPEDDGQPINTHADKP